MSGVNEVREAFLSYFEGKGHMRKASAPLVPDNDPTLLFVNAGMVPFKNIFTGAETPFAPRAATSQKCVRAGGKHNDLDNVGYTARHHTFFEMLGNFSFGDYFKDEAIAFGWELITKELGLSADRLLVTVYSEDEEAAAIWKKVSGLRDERIIRISTSDNFWSMGDTGPCGPCSEIFYDHGETVPGGPPGTPEEDGDRFTEIWNLVFMQFDQQADGTRKPLPKPSIDTGMGLERIAAVLQGVHNNYEIDLFQNLIAAEQDVYGQKAQGERLGSFRVIADHLRTSAFLVADGVTPSSEGRGYVLRRIMRRAMRHAHILGARTPSMHKLVGALIEEMGAAYPELNRARPAIESALEAEEVRFQRTLGRGLALLDEASSNFKQGDILSGETAFKLYDTYGFPIDLTQDIMRGRNMGVDEEGFQTAMDKQKADSRSSGFTSGDAVSEQVWFRIRDKVGATTFLGYDSLAGQSTVAAILIDGVPVSSAKAGDLAELVFPQTPFYAESGGQAGDHGVIEFASGARFIVQDTVKRIDDLHVHSGQFVDDGISLGDEGDMQVDRDRRTRVMANHSATHLLHEALRQALGDHVAQRGSLNAADRLRFDFSHGKALDADQLQMVEARVNNYIRQNTMVETRIMTPDDARGIGAQALFGEKYGDEVRVVSMGTQSESGKGADGNTYSLELCGGTHVRQTGDIGLFALLGDSASSAGVRRIEALTGAAALDYLAGQERALSQV
ncbi:MAG: alanine--tRNA ligase, partial [Henriciella sp.]|nr:alanine--tRNA ligase [Henriciella sp.]